MLGSFERPHTRRVVGSSPSAATKLSRHERTNQGSRPEGSASFFVILLLLRNLHCCLHVHGGFGYFRRATPAIDLVDSFSAIWLRGRLSRLLKPVLPGHYLGLRRIGNVRGSHDLHVVFVEHVQHAAMEFGVEPVHVGRFVGVDIQL